MERTSSMALGWAAGKEAVAVGGEGGGALGRTSSPASPYESPERGGRMAGVVDEDALGPTTSKASTDSMDRFLNADFSLDFGAATWDEAAQPCGSFETDFSTGGGSNLSGSTAPWISAHSQAPDPAAQSPMQATVSVGLVSGEGLDLSSGEGLDLDSGILTMGMRNLSVSNEPAVPNDLSADLLPTFSVATMDTLDQVGQSSAGVAGWADAVAEAVVQPPTNDDLPILELDDSAAAAETPRTPSLKPSPKSGRRTPSERSAKYVPAAGPEIKPELRTCLAKATTPASPSYNRRALTWDGARNTQQRYSYTGSCRPAGEGPAVRCNNCKQFYFIDELGANTLTQGFLPHQHNYEFACAWCNHESSGKLEETFQLKKPLLFEAMVDAVLNMMYEYKRQHFKEDEIRTYLFLHWNTLMFGWPPLEAERSRTGEGTKFRKGGSLAPELYKKSAKNPKCKKHIFQSPRGTYYELCDQKPRQPMDMLRPGEQWDTTSTDPLQIVRSVEPQRDDSNTQERRPGVKAKSMGRLLSRSAVEPGASGAKKHSRTPRPSAEAAALLGARLALPEDDPGVAILAELQEQLQQRMEWAVLLEQQTADIERNAGTPGRVCNLLDKLFELRDLVSTTDVLCAAAVALRKGRLLEKAVQLSRESWSTQAFSKLEEAWEVLQQSLAGQRRIVEQFVEALGQDGATKAFSQAVEICCQDMVIGVAQTDVV